MKKEESKYVFFYNKTWEQVSCKTKEEAVNRLKNKLGGKYSLQFIDKITLKLPKIKTYEKENI